MTVWLDNPNLKMLYHDGVWWIEWNNDLRDWVSLGYAPRPKTARQTISYHIHHGRLMRYPWSDVLPYAWRNRNSFRDDKENT